MTTQPSTVPPGLQPAPADLARASSGSMGSGAHGPHVLRPGDDGPAVAGLRGQLRALGLLCPKALTADETHFDPGVEAAVRAFQQRRGLRADGVVGPQTSRSLDAARWRLGDRALLFTPGHLMLGDDVAELQEKLVVLGLLHSRVDGVFGVGTDAALREIQRSLGLPADGLCGPMTLRALAGLSRSVSGGDPWALRQQAAVAGAGSSLAGKVVVLDPAHGGGDLGVSAGGLHEADITLDVAGRVERRLAASGATPVLTRGLDATPSEAERALLARQVEADLLLSLHCDGSASTRANGVATFYWGDSRVSAWSAVGARLAGLLQRELVARTGMADCRTHPRTYEILRHTAMPAVRVELGYLTHAGDAARLADPAVRDTIAEAVVIAVQRLYLGEDDPTKTGSLRLSDVLGRAGLV